MSDLTLNTSESGTRPTKDRRRSARPERIMIGGVEFARNDVLAAEQGNVTERTINRGDKDGAPFVYIGGVKYRPVEEYHKFLLGRIQRRNRPPPKRRGHRR